MPLTCKVFETLTHTLLDLFWLVTVTASIPTFAGKVSIVRGSSVIPIQPRAALNRYVPESSINSGRIDSINSGLSDKEGKE
jgi:hypothetical protein